VLIYFVQGRNNLPSPLYLKYCCFSSLEEILEEAYGEHVGNSASVEKKLKVAF
jgi:hypothetical protein